MKCVCQPKYLTLVDYSRYCKKYAFVINECLKKIQNIYYCWFLISECILIYIFYFFIFLGQLKRANKGRPGLYSFSGITAKKTTANDHRGKKKQAAIKRHQDSQGFGKMSVTKNYKQTRKNSKCQNRGNCKINNCKT